MASENNGLKWSNVLQGRHATSKFVLEVDGVTWSLCHGREPFIELALATILLDSLRHRDRSGQATDDRTCIRLSLEILLHKGNVSYDICPIGDSFWHAHCRPNRYLRIGITPCSLAVSLEMWKDRKDRSSIKNCI